MSVRVASLLIFALATFVSTSAWAQPRAEVGALFGFGGELTGDDDGEDNTNNDEGAAMNPSFGAYFQYEYPIQRWLMVGGRAMFSAYQTEDEADADIGRSFAIGIDPMVKFRYVFGESDNVLYLAIPFGPSLTIPTSDASVSFGFGNIEASPGIAYNWALLAGISLQGGGDEPGFHIEAGYTQQHVAYNFSGEVTDFFTGTTVEVDERVTGQFWQVGVNVGVSWGM
jgi:hypothetical protein